MLLVYALAPGGEFQGGRNEKGRKGGGWRMRGRNRVESSILRRRGVLSRSVNY